MAPAIESTFISNTTASALLRHYYLLSMNCNRLREDFLRHIRERQAVFEILVDNPLFCEAMEPHVLEFRRRNRRSPSPVPSSPPSPQSDPVPPYVTDSTTNIADSPNTHITILPAFGEENVAIADPPISDPPNSHSSVDESQEVIIHDEPRPASPANSLDSYHTATDEEPGSSPRNPIDVDALNERTDYRRDTPHPVVGILRRSLSSPSPSYCTTCEQRGHVARGCIWNVSTWGRTIETCTFCHQGGHNVDNCQINLRDIARYNPHMQFCNACNQRGHTDDVCMASQFAGLGR